MVQLTLSEREQAALRALTEAEPVPGRPLPERRILHTLSQLVPSDDVVAAYGNDEGWIEDTISLTGAFEEEDRQVCNGPLLVGLIHPATEPGEQEAWRRGRLADEYWLGFRNGIDHVTQLCFVRRHRRYDERDVAVLRMLAPTVQRLMRERPTPQLPAILTVQERRVLMWVAAGHSNAAIAETLVVTESTVRKHLEHAYRKLGVTSRVAAIARLQGRDVVGQDLRERLDRFA